MGKEIFFNGREISKIEQTVVTQGEMEKAQKYEIHDSEFDKTKEQIDWDVINQIFFDFAKKSGIDLKDLNLLGPDKVLNCKLYETGWSGDKEIIGRYSAVGNYLAVNSDQIKKTAIEKGVDTKLMILDTILHELCHSVSHHTHVITRNYSNEFFVGKNEIGYTGAYRSSKDTDKIKFNQVVDSKSQSLNDALDEAITEKMATGIFKEYIQRTGMVERSTMEEYEEKFLNDEGREYTRLVRFIEKLCQVISQKTGVDKEVVWHGFVRGSFYKNTLGNPEIKQWFAETFSPTFLSELGNAKKAKDLFDLINKFESTVV